VLANGCPTGNRSQAEARSTLETGPSKGVSRGPEYCRERIAELRDLGCTVDVLGEDGDVVLAIVWTEDGPMTLAIGEQFDPGRHH
jgi:hypothetical protein